jgi:DNA-binding transcriptional ArsR family regulator
MLEQIRDTFPDELKDAIKALSDDVRMTIITLLLKETELSFSQLKERLQIDSGTLNHHLKILMKAALVDNYYYKKPNISDYSFYALTSFAEDLIFGLTGSLTIRKRITDLLFVSEFEYPREPRNPEYTNEISVWETDIIKHRVYKIKVSPRYAVEEKLSIEEPLTTLISEKQKRV